MFEAFKFCVIVVVFHLRKSHADEERSVFSNSSTAQNNLQLIGPFVEQWKLRDCFQEKSFELIFLVDIKYNFEGKNKLKKEKDFLITIAESLHLGSEVNKVSIMS